MSVLRNNNFKFETLEQFLRAPRTIHFMDKSTFHFFVNLPIAIYKLTPASGSSRKWDSSIFIFEVNVFGNNLW
jgi:hypothetical protein